MAVMSVLKREPVAILLAAGAGSRLGEDKLFLDLGGRQMIERSLRPLRKTTSVSDVLIVVPAGRSAEFEHLRSPHRHIIENPDPARGMISSIRVGLESGWAQERDFLIHPADVPFVKSAVVEHLVRTMRVRDCKIVLPAYRGLGGHPGLFDHAVAQDFFLHGDQAGAREILFRYKQQTVRMAVADPDVCFDVDTPEDYDMAMDASARWARVEKQVEERRRIR
jgi:molybdenum cofactor cytidylyltransferase